MPGAQLLESGLAWYYIDGIRVFRSMNAQHIALIGVEIHLPDLRPSYELVPGHSVNLVHHLGRAYRRVSSANNLNCDDILLCMVQLAVTIPPPPGKPRDKSSPSPPGGVLSLGYKGGEANQKYLFFDCAKYLEVRVISRAVCTNGCGLQDYVFSGENAGICQRLVEEE